MKAMFAVAVAALTLASNAYAQLASSCHASNEICFELNIPNATASSGSGDIYFQLKGPTTKSWIALGQGSSMSGANIFVMYASADGQNVTVSPRLGKGNVMPQHDTAAQITLLEGTGISNGVMTANVQCANCEAWSGGSMDFTASSAKWIYASKSGDSLASDSLTESIQQHDDNAAFTWDLATATGDASNPANPFVQTVASTSGNSTSTAADSGSSSSDAPDDQQSGPSDAFVAAHGSLGSIAFVALYPIGAILIRLARFTGAIWVHVAIQATAYALQIAGAGTGLYIALATDALVGPHQIIGLVLLAVLFFQPLGGYIHHVIWKRRGIAGSRSVVSYIHIWLGRAAILLGIINGGLGLQLAQETRSKYIAYGICAGVVGMVYLVAIIIGEMKRKRRTTSDSDGLEDTSSYGSRKESKGLTSAQRFS